MQVMTNVFNIMQGLKNKLGVISQKFKIQYENPQMNSQVAKFKINTFPRNRYTNYGTPHH